MVMAINFGNMANAFLEMKDFGKAKEYALKSISLNKKMKMKNIFLS